MIEKAGREKREEEVVREKNLFSFFLEFLFSYVAMKTSSLKNKSLNEIISISSSEIYLKKNFFLNYFIYLLYKKKRKLKFTLRISLLYRKSLLSINFDFMIDGASSLRLVISSTKKKQQRHRL